MKKADSHANKAQPVPVHDGGMDAAASAGEITPKQLADLKARAAKADEHWDRLLRTAADFENFKKRAAREARSHPIRHRRAAAKITARPGPF